MVRIHYKEQFLNYNFANENIKNFFENELQNTKDKSKIKTLKLLIKLSSLTSEEINEYALYLDECLEKNEVYQTNKKYIKPLFFTKRV